MTKRGFGPRSDLRWIVAGLLLVLASVPGFAGEGDAESPRETLLDRIDFSGLFYLSYENGESRGSDYSDFFVDRAYLTAKVKILPFLSGRITFDTTQDREGDGAGDMEVRLKYAHAKISLGDHGLVRGLNLEAGIVHAVWLDFEEHINDYRMRDPMFLERSGIFNSADFGVTLAADLGADLGEDYRNRINRKYAGRRGSFAVGIYNGGGYHGQEENDDKVLEGRLTVRPLPESLPGLQISGLAILGEGNQPGPSSETPDWTTYTGMLSYEHADGAITAQFVDGEGNQKGTWSDPEDASEATDYEGWSLFAEQRFGDHWRFYGGLDRFERLTSEEDLSFDRWYAGIAYDLGRSNLIVLDYDRRTWDDDARDADQRAKLVFQLAF